MRGIHRPLPTNNGGKSERRSKVIDKKLKRGKNSGFRGYRSSVVSFIVISLLALVLIFSLVIFPGLISSWRSARLNVKGINECAEGNPGKGEDAFRKAVSLNPDNAAAHYNLALVLLSADAARQ